MIIKFSEWIDRLCGIMIKMHYLNHSKLQERKQKKPDLKKLDEIQRAVDELNEQRYAVWDEIDFMLSNLIKEGKYEPRKERRTYKHDN